MPRIDISKQRWFVAVFFAITSVVVCAIVFIRFSSGSVMSGQLLWAEDGRVFFTRHARRGNTFAVAALRRLLASIS